MTPHKTAETLIPINVYYYISLERSSYSASNLKKKNHAEMTGIS